MAGTKPCLNIAIAKIYKIKRAKFRDDEMSVISGSQENVQIHYEALPAERIEDEKFFKFYQEIGDYTFGLHFILYNEGYSFGWFCIQKNSARTTENTLRYEVRGLRKILESTRQHLKCAITRSMTTRW